MLAKLKVAVLALALAVSGCISNGLPDEVTPEQQYYAVLADYNQAKRVILAYVRLPSTSYDQKVAIAELVIRIDGRIEAFVRVQFAAASGDYAFIISEINKAVLELRIYTAGG